MTLCKFWAQGNCRKGNSCNFEHPSNSRQQNNGNGRPSPFRSGPFGSQSSQERWALNEADIESDLTGTRPQWILSAYGPGKDTPAALFVENEYSPEEVRWRYYQQAHVGNGDAADREAQQLWQKADNDMRNVAKNARDVQKFMEEKDKTHPNRYDLCNMDGTTPRDEFEKKAAGGAFTNTAATADTNSFSKPAFGAGAFGQNQSPFGQPAQPTAFGQAKQSSPFGQPSQSPAFGQPAQPSAFGQPAQPSTFGQPSQPSAFGKPAFGQGAAPSQPAFGQSSAPNQPAFGQTGFGQNAANQVSSKFGAPIQNQSPFGAPSAPPTSAFGQPSAFGQNSNASAAAPTSGFGAGNSFGQAAQPGAFGKPAFGSTAAPTASSPFGGGAAQTSNKSPFGSTAQPSNASPFGNPTQGPASGGAFGGTASQPTSVSVQQSANPFGQPQTANPFGQTQTPSQPSTGFSQAPSQPQQPAPFGSNPPQSGIFGQPKPQQPSSANPFGQTQQPQPPPSNQSPFGQQSQGGFGAQTSAVPPANPANSNGFAGTGQQRAPSGVTNASKLTDKPVRPIHYSQTLPPGRTQTGLNDKLSVYRGLPVQIIEHFRPSAEGHEVKDLEYPVYNRPDGKGSERVWFPNGAQEVGVQKLARVTYDFQGLDDAYDGQVKEQYKYLFENGSFKDHVIPLVPPERGWIDYDF